MSTFCVVTFFPSEMLLLSIIATSFVFFYAKEVWLKNVAGVTALSALALLVYVLARC